MPRLVVLGRRERRRHSISEKRRIVEQTLEPGASVAQVALANEVNASQVFTWRRAFKRGELVECGNDSTALLPVVMAASSLTPEAEQAASAAARTAGSSGIHIEFPGRVLIT